VARRGNASQAFVGALDSADTTELPGVNSRVEYAGGHLLFRRDGALLAQPFDPGSLKVTGSAVTLAEFVVGFASTGFAAFSAGESNLLMYQAIAPANRLVWVDREGREGEFDVSAPRVLFSRQAFADYDVTADGMKFVFVMLDPEAEAGTLNIVLNWTALLRK
jgi:hypothetical protein